MNDPLGLFGDEATTDKDPLGLFGDNQGVLAAAGEAALNLGTNFLLTPVAGLRGLGKLMTGDSLEGAVKGIEQVQEEAYQPRGQRGQTYAENAAKVLNYIPEKIADFGEYVGGNEGRLVGEIGGEFALDLLPFGLLTKATKGKVKPKSDTLSKIREQIAAEAAVETQKPTTGYKPNDGLDGQMNLFEPEVEGRGVSPYEAYPGDWRVDENGIPVRVDLSLEAQNLQNPLQQNLWGDELNPGDFGRDPTATLPMDQDIPGYPRMSQPIRFRNDPENQIGITAAMDQMDPAARTAAIEQTQLGRELTASGELEAAKLQTETLRVPKSQLGAIDTDVFLKDFPDFIKTTLKDTAGKLIPLLRGVKSAYGTGERAMDGKFGKGVYATGRADLADMYAGTNQGANVREVYMNITKPVEITNTAGDKRYADIMAMNKMQRQTWQNRIKKLGFDGLVLKDRDGNIVEAVAFSPEQVKSALSIDKLPFNFKKQGGGLRIDWDDVNKAENVLVRSPDGTYIPTNPNVQEAIAKALEGKDINVFTYTQSGATSTAMKTKNPVVKAASEIVQNAIKRADLAIRNSVFPAENSIKRLNSQELIDLTEIFKDEMFRGERYPAKVLADNLSVKQLEAYTNMRDLFDKTLDAQNAARVLKGQEPISAKEAYLSSRWEGDFRQPVYELVFDENGKPVLDKETKQQKQKLVWYLAAKSKVGLSNQIAALKKQYPALVIDPKKGRVVKGGADRNQLQSMYSTVLDILGRDDPAVQRIREFVEQQTEIEGEGSLAQTKHFERKANIRGFVGDRPGKGGTKAEAIAMMQQQIQYAKNAFKWSELQTAAKDIKEIVSNPELQEKQPNTVNYVREYFKGALGFGESKLATAMDNLVRDMGISPAMAKDAVGNMKTLFILQKLALSTGYTMANLVQSTNMLPYLMDLRSEGFKGNPIKSAMMGYLTAPLMVWSHYVNKAGMNYPPVLFDSFTKDAFKYAEDNGVIARSVYDESPIESSFSVPGTVARYAGKTMTVPETLVRSASFMAYAQMLKDSGKFTDASKLFQKAEELTNKSMVDYRETERPLMFGKAGTAGNFLNTLQTFPISFYNQFAYLAKQASGGKVAGLLTFLALQYVMAGAMGLPYAQDLEKLFEWMRDNVAGDEAYVKMMENEFFSNPRLWLMEHLGESSVYGLLSTETGIGMTSRVSAPNPSDMLQSPAGPISDIYKQGSAALSAAVDPTNTTKLAQAAMLSTPVGLQGLLETAPFMEGITYNTNERGEKVFTKTSDLQDRKGVITRTPEEVAVRQWGLRPQREVSERALAYDEQAASQVERTRATNIVNKYYDAVRRGDMKKANNLQNIYIRLTGKEISNPQMENQVTQEFTDSVTKNTMKANTPAELLRHARVRQYLKEQK